MAGRYLQTHFTPDVLAAQARYYGKAMPRPAQPERDWLTAEELEFIARRDSFYLATVTSDGWPYIQHRGGPPGFLHSVGPNQLAFADCRGNRQMLSTGNLAASDRVAIFLMDYRRRERLKLQGHARVLDARAHPELAAGLVASSDVTEVERVFVVDVTGFDWNCPRHITPRYSEQELQAILAPLKTRVAELERKLNVR